MMKNSQNGKKLAKIGTFRPHNDVKNHFFQKNFFFKIIYKKFPVV